MDFKAVTKAISTLFVELTPVIVSEEWATKDWKDEDKKTLNAVMHLLEKTFTKKLKPTYDRTVWDGNKGLRNLVVPTGKNKLEPLRKETERTKTAEDSAEAPSMEDQFKEMAKSLGLTTE